MVSNSSLLRVLLSLMCAACWSCVLPPLWLAADSNDAGEASPAMPVVADAATRTQAVTMPVESTSLDASMPSSAMMTPNDAGGAEKASSGVGATTNACVSCATNQVCAIRGNDMAGVCVDPHAPCLGLSGTAICDPTGVIYKCGPEGTIAGQQTCASLETCRVGLADGKCPMCAPGSYRCTDRNLLHCAADGKV